MNNRIPSHFHRFLLGHDTSKGIEVVQVTALRQTVDPIDNYSREFRGSYSDEAIVLWGTSVSPDFEAEIMPMYAAEITTFIPSV
jgi:hypothetical protein